MLVIPTPMRFAERQTISNAKSALRAYEINKLVWSHSDPIELRNLSQVNRRFYEISQYNALWIRFLKPDIRTTIDIDGKGTAKKLFSDPINRSHKYLLVDNKGIHYLQRLNPSLRLTVKIIDCIKSEKFSVEQFINATGFQRGKLVFNVDTNKVKQALMLATLETHCIEFIKQNALLQKILEQQSMNRTLSEKLVGLHAFALRSNQLQVNSKQREYRSPAPIASLPIEVIASTDQCVEPLAAGIQTVDIMLSMAEAQAAKSVKRLAKLMR